MKEYQKLKALTQVLVEKNVRNLIETKKTITTTKDVTILYCEIDDFQELIKLYELENGLFDLL